MKEGSFKWSEMKKMKINVDQEKIILSTIEEALIRDYNLYISVSNDGMTVNAILMRKTLDGIIGYFELELGNFLESYFNILSILSKNNVICGISFEKETGLYQSKVYEISDDTMIKNNTISIEQLSVFEKNPVYALDVLDIIIGDHLVCHKEFQNKVKGKRRKKV